MTQYEYKVVPAPTKGRKARGIKGPEGRFANALEGAMNKMAEDGWEFLRAETLPSEERAGLTSSTTTYRSVLVFRRARVDDSSAFTPRLLDPPASSDLPHAATEDADISEEQAPPLEESGSGSRPAEPLILKKENATGTTALSDPDEGDNVSDISIALKARAENQTDP